MAKERIDNSEVLVGRAINLLFRKSDIQKRAFWLETFGHYNNLPKGTSKERRIAKNFVTKTAEDLLQNPHDINFAQEALVSTGNNVRAEDPPPKQQFFQLVNNKCLELIKDDWEKITPGQLSQLVRIYASNDPSKDTAKALLVNYFKGPESRSREVRTYYNLVLATLDLVGDDKAFNEAVKIGFHATDILPRDPSLIGQAVLLSLPYGEDAKVFQKLLIAKYIINLVGLASSQEIMKYHQENSRFISTSDKAKREWSRKRKIVIRKIGSDSVREFNDRMIGFFDLLQRPISSETKQGLKDTWPYSVAFDETDPLNQKFHEALAQNDKLHSQTS